MFEIPSQFCQHELQTITLECIDFFQEFLGVLTTYGFNRATTKLEEHQPVFGGTLGKWFFLEFAAFVDFTFDCS
jgi:hypothetical protein